MSTVAKKQIMIIVLVAAMVLSLASVVFAAEPQYIYYQNANNEVVRASYQDAINNLPDNTVLRDAIRAALRSAIENFRKVRVEDQDGTVIDYAKAVDDGLTYPEALEDLDTYGTTRPTAIKELVIDPDTGQAVEKYIRRVVSVEPLDDIEVDYGTSLADVKDQLPTANNLVVNIADDTTSAAEKVYWDDGTPNYDGMTAQTYSFEGELVMPKGIFNPDNVKAQVNVIVGEVQDVVIVSVEVVTDEDTGLTTVKAVIVNFDEEDTATITVTPDAALGVDDIVVEDIEIDAEGKVEYTFEEALPAGTHSLVVSVGDVVSDAVEFTIEEPDVQIVSVVAVDRTTITATLAEGTETELAEDADNYEVTVGGVDVPVTAAAYNATTRVATLTVDLAGLSGECIVNGVSADVDVPPVPVFESISTSPGLFKVDLNFNTAVYDLNDDLAPADFSVVTDGDPNNVTDVEVADSPADAESIITLTLANATVGDTVTSVTLKASGAAKVVNIWDEPAASATILQLTPEDLDAPEFVGVRAVEGGYTIYLDFSEAVHTGGNLLTASDVPGEDVRVTVNGVRIAAQGDTVDGIAANDATETITVKLDLDYAADELFEAGDVVSVTLASALQDDGVGNHIRDLSNNAFEGVRTRTAVLEVGAGLIDAQASTLLFNGEDDLELSVTLDGSLAADETILVDLSDMDANGFNFTNGSVADVSGSTGTAEVVGNDSLEFTAPAGGVADGTTLTFTIEEGNAAGEYEFDGSNDAVDNSPHEIVFQRSDVGTIAETEVVVIEGFSGFAAVNLVSGKDDQPFSFQFDLEGDLAAGSKIEMDLTALAVKVDFSDVDVTETSNASEIAGVDITASPHTLTKSGNKLIITAGAGGIATGSTIEIDLRDDTPSADIIDVASGAAGQHNLTVTRDDSGASAPFKVTIVGNIINGSADTLNNDQAGQSQSFVFTIDGALAKNQQVRIVIADSKSVEYSTTPADYTITGANAAVVNVSNSINPTITINADENIASGIMTVTVGGVNRVSTVGVINETIDVEVKRLDTNNSDTFDFDVGVVGSTTVTVSTPAGLKNALNDPDIETINLAGGALDINTSTDTYTGQGAAEQTVVGELTVSGDDNTLEDFTIQGDLIITGAGNTVTNVPVIPASPGGNVTISGDDNTLDNVTALNMTITGDNNKINNSTISGTFTNEGTGNQLDNTDIEGDIVVADDKVWNPKTGDLHDTIQAAIDSAVAEDTLYVGPGLYEESLNTINVIGLTLKSVVEHSATIKGGTIRIGGNNVTIDGFTIDNDDGDRAIGPNGSDGSTIINNIIKNSFRGIQGDWHGRPTNLTIDGNIFETAYGIAGTEDMTGLIVTGNIFIAGDPINMVEGIGLGDGVQINKLAELGNDNVDDYINYLINNNEFDQALLTVDNYAIKDYVNDGKYNYEGVLIEP